MGNVQFEFPKGRLEYI